MPADPEAKPVSHFATLAKLLLFLLLLSFAVKNSDMVPLRYFFGLEWQLPLSLALLLAFAAGLVVGLLALTFKLVKARREIATLRRTRHESPKPGSL